MCFFIAAWTEETVLYKVLYNIVKQETHPTQYRCTPREMILHSTFDWELISKHLSVLEADGLVEVQQGDAPSFSITEKGIAHLHLTIPQPAKIIYPETPSNFTSL